VLNLGLLFFVTILDPKNYLIPSATLEAAVNEFLNQKPTNNQLFSSIKLAEELLEQIGPYPGIKIKQRLFIHHSDLFKLVKSSRSEMKARLDKQEVFCESCNQSYQSRHFKVHLVTRTHQTKKKIKELFAFIESENFVQQQFEEVLENLDKITADECDEPSESESNSSSEKCGDTRSSSESEEQYIKEVMFHERSD